MQRATTGSAPRGQRPALSERLAPAAALALVQMGRGYSTPEIGLIVAFVVLSLALHEVAHGWVALKRGDPTARDLGRLSLNPIVHIDPVWTILIPAVTLYSGGILFGGARPVPVDFRRLRSPLRDMSLVAAAGPLTNLLLAIVFLTVWKLALSSWGYEDDELLPRVMLGTMEFNVILFVFNLVPIPPLDGSRIMTWLLPAGLRESYASLGRVGMLLIIALVFFFPPFSAFLRTGIDRAIQFIDIVTGGPW